MSKRKLNQATVVQPQRRINVPDRLHTLPNDVQGLVGAFLHHRDISNVRSASRRSNENGGFQIELNYACFESPDVGRKLTGFTHVRHLSLLIDLEHETSLVGLSRQLRLMSDLETLELTFLPRTSENNTTFGRKWTEFLRTWLAPTAVGKPVLYTKLTSLLLDVSQIAAPSRNVLFWETQRPTLLSGLVEPLVFQCPSLRHLSLAGMRDTPESLMSRHEALHSLLGARLHSLRIDLPNFLRHAAEGYSSSLFYYRNTSQEGDDFVLSRFPALRGIHLSHVFDLSQSQQMQCQKMELLVLDDAALSLRDISKIGHYFPRLRTLVLKKLLYDDWEAERVTATNHTSGGLPHLETLYLKKLADVTVNSRVRFGNIPGRIRRSLRLDPEKCSLVVSFNGSRGVKNLSENEWQSSVHKAEIDWLLARHLSIWSGVCTIARSQQLTNTFQWDEEEEREAEEEYRQEQYEREEEEQNERDQEAEYEKEEMDDEMRARKRQRTETIARIRAQRMAAGDETVEDDEDDDIVPRDSYYDTGDPDFDMN